MMTVIGFSREFVLLLIDSAVKGVILLALAGVVALLSQRASAAFRHLVWVLGIGSALSMLLLSSALPHWRIPIMVPAVSSQARPAEAPPQATASGSQPVQAVQATSVAVHAPQETSSATAPISSAVPPQTVNSSAPLTTTSAPLTTTSAPQSSTTKAFIPSATRIPWTIWALLIWAGGAAVVLMRLAKGLVLVNRVARMSIPVTVGPTTNMAVTAAKSMNIGQPVAVYQAPSYGQAMIPLTFGALKPVVLLPADASQWPEERLRAALLHEMAHVRRQDWAIQLMVCLASAVYWFNPLVWLAAQKIRAESETSCDDLVLSAGIPAADYARHLLDVALCVRDSRRIGLGAVAMAQTPKIEERVKAVLAHGRSRRSLTRRQTVGICAFVVLLTLPMAAMRLMPFASAQTQVASPGYTIPPHLASSQVTVADGHVAVLSGSKGVLPNGYQLSLVGVTQATQEGDAWNMYGGVWWSPDGTPITPQNGWRDGHSHWSVAASHGLAPYTFKITISPPLDAQGRRSSAQYDYHFYEQLVGASSPARYLIERSGGAGATAGPLLDGSAPQTFPGAVSQCLPEGIYPAATRACVVQCGIAAGPWHTVATRSFIPMTSASSTSNPAVSLSLNARMHEMYFDAAGEPHVQPFIGILGKEGLPLNVDRRLIWVDAQGRVIPWSPAADLTKAREVRLQTRPYQTVEFRNVRLQPMLPAGSAAGTAATMETNASAQQLAEAELLRTHLQGWAQANKALLQEMAVARPDDLATVIRVRDSLVRLPIPLWGSDPRLFRGGDDPTLQNNLTGSLTLAHLQRSHEAVETQMRVDFARHRDFVSAHSFLQGHVNVTLWASGRITRVMAGVKGQNEIVPAFFGEDGTSSLAGDSLEVSQNASSSTTASELKPAIGFRRYTSRPLSDGTRYTFLYPSYLANVHQGWLDSDNQFGTVRIDCIGTRPVPWIARMGQVPIPYYIHGKLGTKWLAPHEEFCSVVVGRAGNVLVGRGGNAAFPVGSTSLRRDTQWYGENGSHHHFTIIDKRSHLSFELIHEDRYIPALFKQTDPIITSSFRILPPEHTLGRN